MKYWEIIADNISKAGWSWGCISAVDSRGRTIFIVDAHRDDDQRFVVHADEKLTAFSGTRIGYPRRGLTCGSTTGTRNLTRLMRVSRNSVRDSDSLAPPIAADTTWIFMPPFALPLVAERSALDSDAVTARSNSTM